VDTGYCECRTDKALESRVASSFSLVSGIPGKSAHFFFKGRVALYAILESMGIGPGDEVVLPAYTCVVVPNAILYRKARPIYVDINPETFSMEPAAVSCVLTSRTKVVICQNTYGLSANVDTIVELCHKRGIPTIEDCTHGFGGTYKGKPNGTWCDAAFFSSQWNKPFSTGLGGYAIANTPLLDQALSRFSQKLASPSVKTTAMLWMLLKVRPFISPATYYFFVNAYRFLSKKNIVTGSSSGEELRSTEMPPDYLQTISKVQLRTALKVLPKLADANTLRKRNAELYSRRLLSLHLNHVPFEMFPDHLFLKYPLLVADRKEFMKRAQIARIPLGDWFCSALHPIEGDLLPWGFEERLFPHAVYAAAHVVNLPTDTEIPERTLDFIERNSELILPMNESGTC
jgi:perosamine synthetase